MNSPIADNVGIKDEEEKERCVIHSYIHYHEVFIAYNYKEWR